MFGLFLPYLLAAQVPGTDTLRITADEAVARALSNGPEIARQRVAIERARAERQRVGNFLPSLPELDYSRSTDAPFQAKGEGDWEIGLSQEIEIAGEPFLRRSAADAEIARVELEVKSAEFAIRAEVRQTFARLVAAEVRLRLLDTLAGFARRLDTVAARLLDAEEISELDRNAVRIERGEVEIERLHALTAITDVQAEIAGLLGITGGIAVISVSSADVPQAGAFLDSMTTIESRLASGDESIFQGRPDWQALEREGERLRLERSLASRRWIPNIRLGLSLRSETSVLEGNDITGGSETVRSGFGTLRSDDMFLGFHVGVRVPLPLSGVYDIGRGDVAVVDAELAALEAQKRLLAARIRADVARAAGRLRNAARAVAIYTEHVQPFVRRNLELLERGYSAGELSATQVITQQEQFLRTGESLIEAQREFNEAQADFDRALGR
jgi:cobalt-zinc-cadmium efflux system outer membrane protein